MIIKVTGYIKKIDPDSGREWWDDYDTEIQADEIDNELSIIFESSNGYTIGIKKEDLQKILKVLED